MAVTSQMIIHRQARLYHIAIQDKIIKQIPGLNPEQANLLLFEKFIADATKRELTLDWRLPFHLLLYLTSKGYRLPSPKAFIVATLKNWAMRGLAYPDAKSMLIRSSLSERIFGIHKNALPTQMPRIVTLQSSTPILDHAFAICYSEKLTHLLWETFTSFPN